MSGDGTRIAQGKVGIGARLPEILVARADLAVAWRHLHGDWLSRSDLVGECLEQCFAFGGVSATSTRPRTSMDGRRLFRFHLAYATMEKVYTELVAPGVVDERLPPWQVIAIALMDHLEEIEPGAPWSTSPGREQFISRS